ncbi:Luciferase-like monooxygenase [Arthrobacter sp. OV608]|nr:Luciferase-like monooxygenase [Arthrobacter sp. OV608]
MAIGIIFEAAHELRRMEEMTSVPSEAVDVRVDKWSTPLLNDENRLKMATFATNMRGSVTLANVEGKVQTSWEESLRLAQHADRIGLDAVIPVMRWRGFGGKWNLSDRTFDPFTWATAVLASTKRSCRSPLFRFP